MSDSRQAQIMFEIPKIIHFIWVGDKAMPQKNIGIVLEWKKLNPDCEIWLWVDSERTSFPCNY